MAYFLDVDDAGCACCRVMSTRYESDETKKSRVVESYRTFTDCVEKYIDFWKTQYAHSGQKCEVIRHDLKPLRRRKCQ